MLTKCQTLCEHETAKKKAKNISRKMSCSILAMKQDKINMLLYVKQIMFVNMFYFSSLLFGD